MNGCYDGTSDIIWSYYDDGTFIVEGNGKILPFSDETEIPYSQLFDESKVRTLIIRDGITEIGDYAFFGCSAETVEIASTVKKIGNYSFYGMNNAENIVLSKKITSIGNGAFSCCEKLRISVDINSTGFTVDEQGVVYNSDKTELIFCPVNSDLSDYALPSTLTYIKNDAFNGVRNLKEITFPETLKNIGENAFRGCDNLETVIINYGIENIGTGAFENCNNLREIYYCGSESSLSFVSMDDSGIDKSNIVCGYCSHNDTSVVPSLPASCVSPGYTEAVRCNDCGVFITPKEITTVNHTDKDGDTICDVCGNECHLIIDAGFCCENDCDILWVLYDNGNLVLYGEGEMKNYTVGYSPYYKYRNDITRITVGSGISHIGDYSFYGMQHLENVCGGGNVLSVGVSVFENSPLLNSAEGMSNVITIGDKAFKGCGFTEWILFPKAKFYGVECFYGCKFENVKLSDCAEIIGDRAFYLCEDLKSVFIGSEVSSIGKEVFGKCTCLSEIAVDGFNGNFKVEESVLFSGDGKELIRYPSASAETKYKVPDGTVTVSVGAFDCCNNLSIISLNDDLIHIGDGAFISCGSLTEIEIPFGVETIGDKAFSYCNELGKITIGNSVTSIGRFAFSDCTKLKNITLPSDVEKLSEGIFYNCNKLAKVSLGANISIIEKSAFGFCENLSIILFDGDEKAFDEIELDESSNSDFISAIKHCKSHNVSNIPEILPVCIYPGYTSGEFCAQCNLYLSGHEEIEPEYKEHSMGDYVVVKESTCTEEGEAKANCIRGCDYFETKKIKLKKHQYVSSVVEPTCTDMGYTMYTCSCGDSYFDNIVKASEHKLSDYYIVTKAKCTGEGKERADCTECTYYYERTVSAKGHDYKKSSVIKPTCTSDGYSIYKCSCGAEIKSGITAKLEHSYESSFTVDKKATCKSVGSKSRHCKRCNAKTDVQSIKKISHSYSYVISKATLKKNGSKKKTCSMCGRVSATETIYKIVSVTLSETSYIYDGKSKKPAVTVKDSKGKDLKEGTDYSVKFQSGRKKTGKYTVKITFKGNYSGSKTLSFKIVPPKVKRITSEPSIKSIKLYWNEVKGATGYRIYYYNSKTKKYVAIKDTKNLSYTVKKIDGADLKSGTEYKFAVKAYSDNSGSKVFSYKKTHTSATKPSKAKLKKPVAATGTITVKWKKMACDGYEIVYATNKSFSSKNTVSVKNPADTKKVLKGILKGRTYFIKIRAYKTINGTKMYGYYSDVKTVKAK